MVTIIEADGHSPAQISYGYYVTDFGRMLIASTDVGICRMLFTEDKDGTLLELRNCYPKTLILEKSETIHHLALDAMRGDITSVIPLHIAGTRFQFDVWKALLDIPSGRVISYSGLAEIIGKPYACRAVGTAVGHNPVHYLIPCHRVVKRNGQIGNYHGGIGVKVALLRHEGMDNIYFE